MADRDSLRPRALAAVCATLIGMGAAVAFVPALLRDTTATSSTPVRRDGVAHDVVLAPTQEVCVGSVAFDRDSARVRIWLRRVDGAEAALRIAARAPGYRASAVAPVRPAARVGGAEPAALDVPLDPPARATIGTLCIASRGGRVTLVGTDHPRAIVHAGPTLDGTPIAHAPSVTLLDDDRRSLLARTPELIDRAAALSPFGPWLFWTLIPLLLLVVPALVVLALHRALAADARGGAPDPRPRD